MEIVINFSGGKDSCVMLAFICEKYPDLKKHVVFADTGWEHKGAEDWCREIAGRFGLALNVVRNPNKDFLSMVRNRGKFPSPKHRQCTSDLKRGPIQTWIRNNCGKVVINCMGLRASESANRSKKAKLCRNKELTNSKRTVWDWLPIKEMSDAEVFAYLDQRGIPLHPVYSYLKRFSCRVCIYTSVDDLRKVQDNDPEAISIISNLEREINFSIKPEGFLTEIL